MLAEARMDGELATALAKAHPLVQAAAQFGKVDSISGEGDGLVFLDGSFSPVGVGGLDIKIWFRIFHESPTVVRAQIERFRFGSNEAGPETQVFIVNSLLAAAGAFGKELPSGMDVLTKDGRVCITYLLPWNFLKPLKLITVNPTEGVKHGAKGGLFIVRGEGPDVAKLYAFLESLQKAAFAKVNPMAATLKNPTGSAQKNPAPANEKSTPYPAPQVTGDINASVKR